MKKLQLNKTKRLLLALSFTLFAGVNALYAKNCDYRLFNIKIAQEVTTTELLNQLSNECDFSLIVKDSFAKDKLDETLYGINIKQMTLGDIFHILLSSKNLEYKYSNKILQIGGLITKTFKIDYIKSIRVGKSNTDISLTGDTTAAMTGTRNTGTRNATAGSGGGSLSTGATISSDDSFDFWKNIAAELNSILNTPGDKFEAPTPIVNKETGLITVSGTKKQIKRVQRYIEKLTKSLHKQVMIDVKILSVRLDNSRATGVNWGEIYKLQNMKLNYEILNTNNLKTISNNEITEFGDDYPTASATFMRLSGSTGIADLVKFLRSQGDVTSISNPKVVTLNNQPAVFSSGDQLYYKIKSSSSDSKTYTTSENEIVKSVFAGILLDITPEITNDDEIILKINPSISSVRSQVKTDDSGVRRLPPDLMKKQISSVVKLRDGEKIVLGGLISSKKGVNTYKVPILGNIPIFGGAFKQEQVSDYREELVIIITPHIMRGTNKKQNAISLKELGYKDIK